MALIFDVLYRVHPWLPLAYLAVLGNELLGHAIYCAMRGIPCDITRIGSLSQRGQIGARCAVISWVALAAVTIAILILGALI